jgi:hypothetical protein
MVNIGYPTWSGENLTFGQHDYDQYYRDLWRKSVCQVWKLKKLLDKKQIKKRWAALAETDNDYKVIMAANKWGSQNTKCEDIRIDVKQNFFAEEKIKELGLIEKGGLE